MTVRETGAGAAADSPAAGEKRDNWIEAKQRELSDRGVRYGLASYVDVHGIPKAKSVPLNHFNRVIRGSELFTGAALEGLGQGPDDDELAVQPDPAAITQLPWKPEVAWMPGNLHLNGDPWPMCSRTILQRQVDRAAKMGFVFNLGIECEMFLVRRDQDDLRPANPLDVLPKAAYDVVGTLENIHWLDEIITYMNEMGWDVHSFDHEDANSQFEFDFSYSDVMTTSDRYVLLRLMAKEISRQHGFEVTFMPKPYADKTGSAAHFNMSLADQKTGENLFGSTDDPRGCYLTPLAYKFLAGILAHAPAITAITCPTVNSYKRLIKSGSVTGYTWAPVYISYGGNNRTHMMRVPRIHQSLEDEVRRETGRVVSSQRLECRAVDPSMNPYLASAMMLAAGLDGIENDLDPGDPQSENMYELSNEELAARGISTLPRTLLEAVEMFRADPFSREVLGEDLYHSFADLKEAEWWRYHNTISNWELDEYLTKF